VVGLDVVEITPRTNAACITAGQPIVNLLGAAVRAGWCDRRD
jgi:agmatinase